MALPYIINFTDPLKPSFNIPVAGFNGPGGTESNTTLRLYGRGALDWGEAVDENQVRLTESFSGATSPLNPIDGQVWREVKLYWHNATAGNFAGWYVYNGTTHAWALLNGTGVVNSGPTTPAIGNYYFDGTAAKLYLYDSRYKQQAATYFERSFSSNVVAPGTTHPETFWKVYSTGAQDWLYTNTTIVSATTPLTANTETGQVWYNPTTAKLSIYNGAAWVSTAVSGAAFDLGGYDLTGLPAQTYPLPNSNNGATISYVNQAASAALSGSGVGGIAQTGIGLLVKTSPGAYIAREIYGGTGILISNPLGTAGNPTVVVDTNVIATRAYVNSAVSSNIGVVTVEPISAGVPSNATGNNGDIRYQY